MHAGKTMDPVEDVRRDLLCVSSARWGASYERPHHLMLRAARDRRVIYVEAPAFEAGPAHLSVRRGPEGITVVTPTLPAETPAARVGELTRRLIDQLVAQQRLHGFVLWTDTPRALAYVNGLDPAAIVYDCAGEAGADDEQAPFEELLVSAADVVFTAGPTLHAAMQPRHGNCHLFPGVVDVGHFLHARRLSTRERPPADQGVLPAPRIGFLGTIDHQVDLGLVDELAALRPDLHVVLVGPMAREARSALPRRPNVSWLGQKTYAELPYYLAGWAAAILPYVRGPSTQAFAPAHLPEYLAAGRAVISTPLPDVVAGFGELGVVRIADSAQAFAAAIDASRAEAARDRNRRADRWLATVSWDRTWSEMDALVADALVRHADPAQTRGRLRDLVPA